MKFIAHNPDLIVLSLQKWGAKGSRLTEIMSRLSRHRRVYFIESPVLGVSKVPLYLVRETREQVIVIEPYLPQQDSVIKQQESFIEIVDKLIADESIQSFSIWTDTPNAIPFFRHLTPRAIFYDCKEDYSAEHPELEKELLNRADIVLVSSPSLYATKKLAHSNIHLEKNHVDYRHFFQGRYLDEESEEIKMIPHPRIGYAGPIDESLELGLISNLARLRPNYHFVIAGDVDEISADQLPQKPNIHYLKAVSHLRLPLFLSQMDCTFLPFKINQTTRFLNPDLAKESLIAGRPVVCTPLPDLVTTYQRNMLLSLADFPIDFINRLDYALEFETSSDDWLEKVDETFKEESWSKICAHLEVLEKEILEFHDDYRFEGSLIGMVTAMSCLKL